MNIREFMGVPILASAGRGAVRCVGSQGEGIRLGSFNQAAGVERLPAAAGAPHPPKGDDMLRAATLGALPMVPTQRLFLGFPAISLTSTAVTLRDRS
jgi:hypothetical protein